MLILFLCFGIMWCEVCCGCSGAKRGLYINTADEGVVFAEALGTQLQHGASTSK
jgi:hypothetical protein